MLLCNFYLHSLKAKRCFALCGERQRLFLLKPKTEVCLQTSEVALQLPFLKKVLSKTFVRSCNKLKRQKCRFFFHFAAETSQTKKAHLETEVCKNQNSAWATLSKIRSGFSASDAFSTISAVVSPDITSMESIPFLLPRAISV